MTAWWTIPIWFALIATLIIQYENWLLRRERRARREGRRQAIRWTQHHHTQHDNDAA